MRVDRQEQPFLSVIIPTIARYEMLNETLSFLKTQNFSDFEVLIIDQNKDFDFKDKINSSSEMAEITRCFKLETASASKARNIGLSQAKGEIVLFLDDDVRIPDRDFLHHHVGAYEDENTIGVVGAVLEERINQRLRFDKHPWSENKEWGWLFFPQNYGLPAKVAVGRSCNLSVRRDLAIDVMGMDERFAKGAHREEADFCLRLVKKYGLLDFNPKAWLIHIGTPHGGIRNWDKVKRKVPAQHHFNGAFYFLFKNVRLKYWPPHLLSIFQFFFWKKYLRRQPFLIPIVVFRCISGSWNAMKLLVKGPIYTTK